MGVDLLLSLLISLVLTLGIELAFALVLRVRGRDLLVVVLANCLTNPPVVLLYSFVKYRFGLTVWPFVILLESAAVLAEWLSYRGAARNIKKPFWFSLGANCLSYLVGLGLPFLL